MTCNLESKPDPQIKWFRETTEVKDGGRYIVKLDKDAKTADGFVATLQIKVIQSIAEEQGLVVQSIVSLTTSLRRQFVKYMPTTRSNPLLFFVEKM